MRKINYKSDFDFLLKLKDCHGNPLGFPTWDWQAKFYTTSKVNAYEASCIGGECINCYNDKDEVHIVCDNHRLGPGTLNMEFTSIFANDIYGDGDRKVVSPIALDIELVREMGQCVADAEIAITMPYVKGENGRDGKDGRDGRDGIDGLDGRDGRDGKDFTYDDMTEEQKRDLAAHIPLSFEYDEKTQTLYITTA